MAGLQRSVKEFVADYYIKIKRDVLTKLGVEVTSTAQKVFSLLGSKLIDSPAGQPSPTKTASPKKTPVKSAEDAVKEQLRSTMKLNTKDIGTRYGLHISLITPELKQRSLTPGKSSESSHKQSVQDRTPATPNRFKSTPRKQEPVKKKLITTAFRGVTSVPSAAELLQKESLDKRKVSQRTQIEAYFKALQLGVSQDQGISAKLLKKTNKLLAKVKSKSIYEFAEGLFPVVVEFLVDIAKLKPNSQLSLTQLTRLSQLISLTQPTAPKPKQELTEDQQQLKRAATALKAATSNLSIKYITVRTMQELKELRQLTYESGCVLSALLSLFVEVDSHISVLPSFKLVESQLAETYRSYFAQPGSVISLLRTFEQLVKERKISDEAAKRAKDYLSRAPTEQGTEFGPTYFIKQYLEAALSYLALFNAQESQLQVLSASSPDGKAVKPQLDRLARQKIVKSVYSPGRHVRTTSEKTLQPQAEGDLTKEFHEFIKIKLRNHVATDAIPAKAQAITFAVANQSRWLEQFVALYTDAEAASELFMDQRFRSEVLICAESMKSRSPATKKAAPLWNAQLVNRDRKRLDKRRTLEMQILH